MTVPWFTDCDTKKKSYLHSMRLKWHTEAWTGQTSQAESRHCRPQYHLGGWKASHSSCTMAMEIALDCCIQDPSQTLPEESGVDSLADNDVGELEVSLVDAGGLEALLNSLDLVLQHVVDLPITHSIPAQKIILQILTSDNKTIYTNS